MPLRTNNNSLTMDEEIEAVVIVLNKRETKPSQTKQNQFTSVLNVSLAKFLQCIYCHGMLRAERPYDFFLLRII